MPYITDAQLRGLVSDLLKKAGAGSLPSHQLNILSRANTRAHGDILRYLGDRGFTAAQADTWRDRVVCNQDLAIYYAILEIGILKRAYREQLDQYCKWIPDAERGRDHGLLQTVRVVDGTGEPITPGADDAPIANCVGRIDFDEVDDDGRDIYTFKRGMDF